ncbi:hypothetical protein AGR1A_Lc80286 [Agrobacterium fabacearum CFBP 5771]|nr:hypothetical protein AGR1A_Lc80286 [Agrobacterium fabacearum CFBP 5771]
MYWMLGTAYLAVPRKGAKSPDLDVIEYRSPGIYKCIAANFGGKNGTLRPDMYRVLILTAIRHKRCFWNCRGHWARSV